MLTSLPMSIALMAGSHLRACLKSPKGKASRSEQQEFTKVNEQRSDEDNAAFWLFRQALTKKSPTHTLGRIIIFGTDENTGDRSWLTDHRLLPLGPAATHG